jgi:hypothetical protein
MADLLAVLKDMLTIMKQAPPKDLDEVSNAVCRVVGKQGKEMQELSDARKELAEIRMCLKSAEQDRDKVAEEHRKLMEEMQEIKRVLATSQNGKGKLTTSFNFMSPYSNLSLCTFRSFFGSIDEFPISTDSTDRSTSTVRKPDLHSTRSYPVSASAAAQRGLSTSNTAPTIVAFIKSPSSPNTPTTTSISI